MKQNIIINISDTWSTFCCNRKIPNAMNVTAKTVFKKSQTKDFILNISNKDRQ